jgi:glyoxylase-like metal-dependent hydrolase (beta-lactamase superfamily II)
MRKRTRRLLIGASLLLALLVLVIAALFAFLTFSVLPLQDGRRLGGGAVTTVVAGHFGPVKIAAYVVELNGGGVALIDAGNDATARAIREELERSRRTPADVRAIFLTHAHADHAIGARAFPTAQVYALGPDARAVARARPLQDGELVEVSGTRIEVFAVPGHTPGSAAFLVHGVLFLGDSAAAARDRSFQPNAVLGDNPKETPVSLHRLAERLSPRRNEVRAIAFGHQGSLDGVDPLLEWAKIGK